MFIEFAKEKLIKQDGIISKMKSKRNVFLWTLYDFANSIVSITFFLYFAQWIVIDRGISDLYFNLTFTVSAIILFLSAPVMASLLDRSMRRISGLRYTTVLTTVFYGICAFFAVSGREVLALIFFTLGLYFYLLSFTFYTPLLNSISKPERRGLVSGLGISANYLGQFAGLLIALPFSTGKISLFGSLPRAETLLPAVLIFFIFSLPTLLFFKEPMKKAQKFSLKLSIKQTLAQTKLLISSSSVLFFLIAYFFFNDAILTAGNNFPIFLEQVWNISDTIKTYILMGILITSAVGGTLSGLIADRFGHKKTLMFVLFGWIIILPAMGWLGNFTLFVVVSVIMGFWFGANWAVSRSVMSYVAPKGKQNLAFTYFGLAERASSFIGPIVWGLVVSGLISLGSIRYRIAVLAVTVFIILGLFALSRVKDDKK